ncbi:MULTISPECIES: rhamnan synthesis F family protein [unclassified Candidatus Paralachnospira]|uniref:rhamnan synthesis F family protein n=1 Tax=unclassified Candidatus Paralachnospira TaxID=3099471 RepID=UPI003F93BFBA
MKLKKGSTNRGIVYFFYDRQGVVDRYVIYMLEHLKQCCKDLFFVVNGTLTDDSREKVAKVADKVWERENKGLDVAAYKYALEHIGWENLGNYDELVLMNHTIMGPVYPLMEMFDSMGSRDLDFWGTNIFYKVGFDPYGIIECGYIRDHLQSHFIVARQSLLKSKDYREYWETLPPITNYKESVAYHETYFTHHFAELGYKWEAYAHWDGLEQYSEYPLLKMPTELLKRTHCPFFKRRSFMHDNQNDYICSTFGEPTAKLIEFLKTETDYDTDMIWENVLRCDNQADIKQCANLNYVLSSVQSEDMGEVVKKKGAALIYHFYYEDCLADCLKYAASMPPEADIYITVGSEEKKKLVEKAFASFPNKVEVILIKNRGRDVSALLIGAREVVPKYEYICFAHDKKVTQLRPMTQGAGWSYKCFESVLKNRDLVNNVIRTFEENPRLGMLSPAPPNHGGYYSLLGDEWTTNFDHVKELAEKLGFGVSIKKEKEPIAPIGTIFWFRSKALKPLFDVNWKYEDFPKEPSANDGTLSHTIERFYPYAVQEAGYYPAWVFSDNVAAQEITNLTYMLRGYNITLKEAGLNGAYYNDAYNNLRRKLEMEKKVLAPKLYLDYGKDFNEKDTIEVPNWDRENLRAEFYWPETQGVPINVRLDPNENGGFILKDLELFYIYGPEKRKRIQAQKYFTNGEGVPGGILFRGEDPWIIIREVPSKQRPVGISVYAKVDFQEDEKKKD